MAVLREAKPAGHGGASFRHTSTRRVASWLESRAYSANCREHKFSETELPLSRGLGNWAAYRDRLARGHKKRESGLVSSPDSPTHLSYGHFFKPPGDVSWFCPGGHLPVGLVSGLPLPGPSLILANAGIAVATTIAAKTKASARTVSMRFIVSPPLVGSRSEQFHLAFKRLPPLQSTATPEA